MKYLHILLAILVCAVAFGAAKADEPVSDDEVVVPPPRPAAAPVVEEPVTAPPPAFVAIERTSVGLGIGLQWGQGTLQYEGEKHSFRVTGLSVGDLGASRSISVGDVQNLNDLADFEGNYVAVEAGAAAGPGVAALTMRNAKGVVITVTAEQEGGRLQLGPEGLRIAMD